MKNDNTDQIFVVRCLDERWIKWNCYGAGWIVNIWLSGDGNIAAVYAEQCINASPRGPFSADCRKILAEYLGLSFDRRDRYFDIRTKAEIENTIRVSVSMNDPFILEELFPLMALPENAYTLYAVGALKALASVPEFRSFFIDEEQKSIGRLAERLNYISRG
jgi:hypothetical protein